MLLTIDVGNTNTVLGMFDGDEIVEHWRINTDPDRTADEIAVLLRGLLEHSALVKDADVSGIALCSTVPSVLHEMREMFRRYYGDIPALIVEPGVRTGVSVRMDNPKEVGSDRIMNTVAAVHLYGGRPSWWTSAPPLTSTRPAPRASSSAGRWRPASRSRWTR